MSGITRKQWSSCDPCRTAKVKCDLHEQASQPDKVCSYCLKRGFHCTVDFLQLSTRSKRIRPESASADAVATHGSSRAGASRSATFRGCDHTSMARQPSPDFQNASSANASITSSDVMTVQNGTQSDTANVLRVSDTSVMLNNSNDDRRSNRPSSRSADSWASGENRLGDRLPFLNVDDAAMPILSQHAVSQTNVSKQDATATESQYLHEGLQNFCIYAHAHLPVVDLDEVRTRFKTELFSKLPSYLQDTLAAIGNIYQARFDHTMLEIAKKRYLAVLEVVRALSCSQAASLDLTTALVLLLYHRPMEISFSDHYQLVMAIQASMTSMHLLDHPQLLFPIGSRKLGVVKHLVWLHFFAEVHACWPGITDHGIDMDMQLDLLCVADEQFLSSSAFSLEFPRVPLDDTRVVLGLQFNEFLSHVSRLKMKAIREQRLGRSLSEFVKPILDLKTRLPDRLRLSGVSDFDWQDPAHSLGALANIFYNSCATCILPEVVMTILSISTGLPALDASGEASLLIQELLDLMDAQIRVIELLARSGAMAEIPPAAMQFAFKQLRQHLVATEDSVLSSSRLARLERCEVVAQQSWGWS